MKQTVLKLTLISFLTSMSFNLVAQCGVCNNTNTFFGIIAGESTVAGGGIDNSFFGRTTGNKNTSGNSNSFFGKDSGRANTTASDNSFFGMSSGEDNTTGVSNSFFGRDAGSSNTVGKENCFFGRSAGSSNESGDQNTFVGYAAGSWYFGSGNVCIGYRAGSDSYGEDSNGDPIQVSNKLYIANDSNTPLIYGEFDTELVRINGEFEVTAGMNNNSSVHVKENFATVDEANILSLVMALPITEWSYIEKPDIRHVGPMAQDFRAAFSLGKDDTSISTIDADGISLAAIKALAQRDIDDKVRIDELEQKNDKLEKTVLQLIKRLEKLEKG